MYTVLMLILKSEDFSMEDSDEEKKREKSILKLDPDTTIYLKTHYSSINPN